MYDASKFNFSIDEIELMDKSRNIFNATILPDIKTNTFSPHLLRSIRFSGELLTKEMYYALIGNSTNGIGDENRIFYNSVKQGGYYSVKSNIETFRDALKGKIIVDKENDFFEAALSDSPYPDVVDDLETIPIKKYIEGLRESDQGIIEEALYIYGFNVGQGDSLLVITSSKKVFLIDTNFYTSRKKSIDETIKNILAAHGIGMVIDGLVITHKHIDHIRGSWELIDSGIFTIKAVYMNFDYKHDVQSVLKLKQAIKKVNLKVNINQPIEFSYNGMNIKVTNPDSKTNNSISCPDLNDSSISIYIEIGDSGIYLTGDTGYGYLGKYLSISNTNENMLLKVSHHGSRTGTDKGLLSKIKGGNLFYSFISAGENKKYNHPHQEVTKLLRNFSTDIECTKNINNYVLYIVDRKSIQKIVC
ncbi:MBL fold metallo-hydrolase [Bacillus sp. JJ1532]|uniref:ComEC/Rec2 family competence protein n=1 Tax=Bacillus sp. JJ1532 TaxID=3122958 RepID=UPI0030005A2A